MTMDNTTDPGQILILHHQQQNFFTFFDPNLGRYRSGTYDEYLKYVTAKDGGIIQLQQGGSITKCTRWSLATRK